MLKDYKPAHPDVVVSYTREFTDEHGNGFSFYCNAQGEIDVAAMPEMPRKSYEECMAHPERFAHYNAFMRREDPVMEPASGTCSCGERIELYNQYMGACQCPVCGSWYNLFGQSLLPPGSCEEW